MRVKNPIILREHKDTTQINAFGRMDLVVVRVVFNRKQKKRKPWAGDFFLFFRVGPKFVLPTVFFVCPLFKNPCTTSFFKKSI